MAYLLLTWLLAPWLWLRASLRRAGTPQRIAVIHTAKIGDFVAVARALRSLKQRAPAAQVVLLLNPVNEPLARHMRFIDQIVPLPPRALRGWRGKLWLWRALRNMDTVLVLTPSLPTLLAPLWAGARHRVSVIPDRRLGIIRFCFPFLTARAPHLPGRMFRETALDAVALAVPASGEDTAHSPAIDILPTSTQQASVLLAPLPRPWIGLGIAAGNTLKSLTPAQLTALCRDLLRRTRGSVVLIGGSADRGLAEILVQEIDSPRLCNTAGQFALDELPGLLVHLDVYVGVDSGVTYLADEVGTPVVDFMGPANAADQRPIGARAMVIKSDQPCAPCSHTFDAPYACRLGTRACIAKLDPALLANAAIALLDRRGADLAEKS